MSISPDAVIAVADNLLAQHLAEYPDGSNHNLVTIWYGFDGPWCAMDVSYCLAHGGFSNDGGNTCFVPGVQQTTNKGWAYVPYLYDDFKAAGLLVATPQRGDIGMVPGLSHTFLIDNNNGNGTVTTLEGNYSNREVRNVRGISGLIFARPPYSAASGVPSPPPPPPPPPPVRPGTAAPPWPGVYFKYPPVTNGHGVAQWQGQMANRGWHVVVDDQYGPASKTVAIDFQREKGLTVDGVVGSATWAAAWTSPVTP